MLRIPAELHALAKTSAKENGRSLNGEIVWQLRRAYQQYYKP